MSTHDRVPVEGETPRGAPHVVPVGAEGAAALAGVAGNRAFARVVPVHQRPPGPTVQRLIPLAIIGAGLIYVSGEQRGWWGGDEVNATGPGSVALTKKAQLLGRARGTLTSQIAPGFERCRDAAKEVADAPEPVVKHIEALKPAITGLGLPKEYRDQAGEIMNALRDAYATLIPTVDFNPELDIGRVRDGCATAVGLIREAMAGGATAGAPPPPAAGAPAAAPAPAPAPPPAPSAPAAAPAPAAGPAPASAPAAAPAAAPAPLTPDQIAALEGIAEQLTACQSELVPEQGVGRALKQVGFIRDAGTALSAATSSAPEGARAKLTEAAVYIRNTGTLLYSLSRTEEERATIAAERLDFGARLARELSQQLEIAEKEIRERLDGAPAAGEQPA